MESVRLGEMDRPVVSSTDEVAVTAELPVLESDTVGSIAQQLDWRCRCC